MTNHVKEITFAIPYYSGLNYLQEAIQSVVSQDIDTWQLVVVDDSVEGSNNVQNLVESFKDSRIRYRRNNTSGGMANNWNECLQSVNTNLVTLLHADDRLLSGYGRMMLEAADKFPDAVAFTCRSKTINAVGRRVFSLVAKIRKRYEPCGNDPVVMGGESYLVKLLRGNFIVCPTLCYRRKLIEKHAFDRKWQHVTDLDFVSRLLIEGFKIIFLSQYEYEYRRHRKSATVTNTESMIRFIEMKDLYREIQHRVQSLGWNNAVHEIKNAKGIKHKLLFAAVVDVMSFRWSSCQKKISFLSNI